MAVSSEFQHASTEPVNDASPTPGANSSARALRAYLLGTLEFDDFLALQRRLVYDISGDRQSGAVVLCDHPPGITIGREGSRAHIRPGPEDLHTRGWPVRWVSRGGGTMLHQPGQVACYPVVPLDAIGLTVAAYLGELQSIIVELLRDHELTGTPDPDHPGIRVNGRLVAHIGVAVRDNITCFGVVLNAEPDLAPFRDVRCDGDALPMTSLQREAAGRVRLTSVRQRLVELLAARFNYDRVSLFHTHPAAFPQPTQHAAAQRT
jgi:lipoyl(octanoyl) transferase